mmetsp:Transcript_20155/g.61175  ORF Transcript_20155/g.61175 Transcript_20155/m.61175 type:complete len:221 (-) Transcript_20155:1794-2456(-)
MPPAARGVRAADALEVEDPRLPPATARRRGDDHLLARQRHRPWGHVPEVPRSLRGHTAEGEPRRVRLLRVWRRQRQAHGEGHLRRPRGRVRLGAAEADGGRKWGERVPAHAIHPLRPERWFRAHGAPREPPRRKRRRGALRHPQRHARADGLAHAGMPRHLPEHPPHQAHPLPHVHHPRPGGQGGDVQPRSKVVQRAAPRGQTRTLVGARGRSQQRLPGR